MRRHSWERISQLFQSFVKNLEDLTLKQMFDVTAKLVGEQEEIKWAGQNSVGKEFLDTSVVNW